ncbi:MAG: S41 family peptidase [Planctomycetota bacterium]
MPPRRSLVPGLLAAMLLVLAACASDAEPAPEVGEAAAPVGTTLSARSRRLQFESFDEVWTTVRDRHWDPSLGGLDWEGARAELRPRIAGATRQAEAREIMNELVSRLGQSHFAVFPGPTSEEELVPVGDPRAELETAAESAALRAAPRPRDLVAVAPQDRAERGFPGFELTLVEGRLMITRVATDSPAARDGIEIGWELLAVGGQVVEGRRIAEEVGAHEAHAALHRHILAQRVASAPIGEVVPMRFETRDGRERELEIRMTAPEGEEFALGEQLRLPTRYEARRLEGGVGYFALSAFANPVAVMQALGEFLSDIEGAPGLILDLRNNPGGLGAMASGISGFFVEERGRDLGSMITRGGELRFVIFPRAETFPGRLAILVNGASASTSEILPAGLQDLERGRVFGETTAGAVLPSEISTLPNGDGFQFATADFVTPRGVRLEGRGAIPDVVVHHTVADLRRGVDRPLEAARTWILEPAPRKGP